MHTYIRPLTMAIALAATGTTLTVSAGPSGNAIGSIARIFQAVDTNQDGVIDTDEFMEVRLARAQVRFDALDSNADGYLTEGEIGERPEPPEDADPEAVRACVADTLGVELQELPEEGERFAELDLNDDGAVDFAESQDAAMSRALEAFAALDTNASGDVTPEEVGASLGRKAERRAAIRACRQAAQDAADILG